MIYTFVFKLVSLDDVSIEGSVTIKGTSLIDSRARLFNFLESSLEEGTRIVDCRLQSAKVESAE